jgi:hypothetical protein
MLGFNRFSTKFPLKAKLYAEYLRKTAEFMVFTELFPVLMCAPRSLRPGLYPEPAGARGPSPLDFYMG